MFLIIISNAKVKYLFYLWLNPINKEYGNNRNKNV